MTKALIYPGADRTRWYGDKFDGRIFDDLDKLLLHSTETDKRWGCPGYSTGGAAPTLTVNPWPGYRRIWQHFPLNESARALLNPSSTTVSENKDNVCQIEIIGYSDKGYGLARGCYLPNLDADSRQWLANIFAFIMREWTIPNVWAEPFPWPIYPASYGNTPSRMTSSEYDRFAGVLGHLHASGNDHGDPSLNVVDLRARVGALLNNQEVSGMSAEDVDRLIDHNNKVWLYGYKESDGTDRPPLLRILVENQRRITNTGKALTALSASLGPEVEESVREALAEELDPAVLAAAVAAALPQGAGVTDEQLEAALRKVLGSVDDTPEAGAL